MQLNDYEYYRLKVGNSFFDFFCKAFLLQYVHFYIMLQDYNFAFLTYCFQRFLVFQFFFSVVLNQVRLAAAGAVPISLFVLEFIPATYSVIIAHRRLFCDPE